MALPARRQAGNYSWTGTQQAKAAQGAPMQQGPATNRVTQPGVTAQHTAATTTSSGWNPYAPIKQTSDPGDAPKDVQEQQGLAGAAQAATTTAQMSGSPAQTPGANVPMVPGAAPSVWGNMVPKQGGASGTAIAAPNNVDGTQAAPSDKEEPIDYQKRFDDEWADIQKQQAGSLEGQLQSTYADESLAGRRMAEMNALGGGGAGGGAFAGGSAQVALGGMQQRLDVRNENNKQALQMKMAVLGRFMEQAEREKDRDLQGWLQNESDQTAMKIAGMGYEDAATQREADARAMEAQAKRDAYDPHADDSTGEDVGNTFANVFTAGFAKSPFGN